MAETEARRALPPQVRKLNQTAAELRSGAGTHFFITRLTSIKSLCKQPEVAAAFVFHLAERTLERMQAQGSPAYMDPADWARYRIIVAEAVAVMREGAVRSLYRIGGESPDSVIHLLRALADVQPHERSFAVGALGGLGYGPILRTKLATTTT